MSAAMTGLSLQTGSGWLTPVKMSSLGRANRLLCAVQSVATPFWLTCPSAGVLYLGRADGVLEVWDLLDRSHEPSMTANPTSSAITSLSFSPAGAPAATGGRAVQQLLAVGEPRVPSVQYARPGPAAAARLVSAPRTQLQTRWAGSHGRQRLTVFTDVCLVPLAIPARSTWQLCRSTAFMASKW